MHASICTQHLHPKNEQIVPGMHALEAGGRPERFLNGFILFPHRQLLHEPWDGYGFSPAVRYCAGDKESLKDVLPCIANTISHARAQRGRERVLVLLATDRPDLITPLIDTVGNWHNVTVIRTYPSSAISEEFVGLAERKEPEQAKRRASIAAHVGAMDATLLTLLSDVFLGTAHSTYSYVIHARALLSPFYTGHTPQGCYQAPTSQAGLVSKTVRMVEGDEADEIREVEEDACTVVYMLETHGCLESLAPCRSRHQIREWAEALHLPFDWEGFNALKYARTGWRDLPHIAPFDGMVCQQEHINVHRDGERLAILDDPEQVGPPPPAPSVS